MTKIGILGAQGKMGRSIQSAAADLGLEIAGAVDRDGAVLGAHADAEALARHADVLVDFTRPEPLAAHLRAAVAANKPIVVGTTGLLPEHHALLDEAARHVAVLQSANTSLGIAVLRHLVEQAAARLGTDWDLEIVEMHHRQKVDAPSGTALLLGASAAKGRGSDLETLRRDGHEQKARELGTIGFAALRGGTVAGEHTVLFASEHERLELTHRAENRSIFARGAVRAAQWLAPQKPGRYTMNDVLGIE